MELTTQSYIKRVYTSKESSSRSAADCTHALNDMQDRIMRQHQRHTCDHITFSETRLGSRRVCCYTRNQDALCNLREVWILLSHLCRIVLIKLQHLDTYVGPDHTPHLLQLLDDIFGGINGDGKADSISTQDLEAC